MYRDMKQWSEIRRRVLNKEISKRQACREYGVHWDTLRKIEENVEPPAIRWSSPRAKSVLTAYLLGQTYYQIETGLTALSTRVSS